jgi:hypothetical protein
MATAQWTGFIHSWHTLGIVLKWMWISIIGIPFAILTCLLIGLAALVFFGLILLAAFLSCLLVFYVFVSIYYVAVQFINFVVNSKRLRKGLPLVEPRRPAIPTLPIQELRMRFFRTRTAQQPILQPLQTAPDYFNLRRIQAPPQAHLGPNVSASRPVLASRISGLGFECQVCMEEKDRSQFPIRSITDDCNHEQTDCCSVCLSESIAAAFHGNLWDNIRCPICNVQLCHRDVAEFATREIFER